MDNYTVETERVLRNAGWIPGRKVDIGEMRRRLEESGFIVNEAAEHFLSEFGGLVFDISGSGISRARERFILDPLLAIGEDDRFAEWSETVGETLTPIGELDYRFFLGISESGEIYSVETWLGSFGLGQQALENLILGVAVREIA
ncbi:SUKH-3 immunity protein [Penicillium canescens]|nr:SUKH-3 immunity protein [Penicillium canescens]